MHAQPVSALPVPQLNISSSSSLWNRHSSPSIKPLDKLYQTPLGKASTTSVPVTTSSHEKKEKQKGILGRFRAKRKEESGRTLLPDPCLMSETNENNPYPLANLGVLAGSNSFSDLHLPNTSTGIKHQQSFSSLSSGGGTPNQPGSTFNFATVYPPQTTGTNYNRSVDPKEVKASHQQHHHHGLFHRHHSPSQSHTMPPNKMIIDDEEIILDTDLGQLQGIVSNRVPQSVLEMQSKNSIGEINPVAPWEASSPRVSSVVPGQSDTWTAPESWGVRPHNQITEELPEFPTEPEELSVVPKQAYCLRVFRTDSTFATIPCPANTSVGELVNILAKKFFVPPGERWVLVHYMHNLARVLQASERPLQIQQHCLKRLGYVEEQDGGGEMGRDDWSGCWRFVFMKSDALANTAVSQ